MKTLIIIRHAFYTMLLFFVSIVYNKAYGQKTFCPEPRTNKAQLERMLQYRNAASKNFQAPSAGVQLRLIAHIVSQDDGSHAGALPQDILTEVATMNADFAAAGICFVYVGYDEIRNSKLNHIIEDADHTDNAALFEPYVVSNCLNIFYVDSIAGVNGASGGKIGGITFDLPNNFCLVGRQYLGRHTSSHETGHCLGLFHTFEHLRFGYENIDGSSCSITGDLICDTHADPYAYNDQFCYAQTNGHYSGFCTDPEGHNNWDPPYNNIMSYWHEDPETFTAGQNVAMLLSIGGESILSNLKSSDNITLNSLTYNFSKNFVSAIHSITTVGNVQVQQIAQTGFFSEKVILNPGFHAMPAIGGYAKVRAYECGTSVTLSANSTNTEANTGKHILQQTNSNALLVYPNPSKGIFTIQYKENGRFSAYIIIRNTMGQIIYKSSLKEYFNNLSEEININGNIAGIYVAEIISGNKHSVAKIMIQ